MNLHQQFDFWLVLPSGAMGYKIGGAKDASQKMLQISDKRLWLLRILILPSNFPKMWFLALNFALLDGNFGTRRIFDDFPIAQNFWVAVTMPMVLTLVLAMSYGCCVVDAGSLCCVLSALTGRVSVHIILQLLQLPVGPKNLLVVVHP